MSEIKIVIPDQEVLRQRLLKFSNDQHFIKGLYPKIEKCCGHELVPDSVITIIELAIYDYATPQSPMYSFLNDRFTKFIEAMVLDEEARSETIRLFEEFNK